MSEPGVSLQDVGHIETLHPKMERRKMAWRFQLQAGEREEGWGWGQGMTLGLALFHVPSMAVLLDPSGREEGGCHPRGLRWGLSRSVLPTSPQVFLKEAAGNHPRSSGVSHACTGGPNMGAKAHSGAGVPGSPAVPVPSGSGSPALSMCPPLLLQVQEVKARPMAKRPGLGLEGSFVFYLGQLDDLNYR